MDALEMGSGNVLFVEETVARNNVLVMLATCAPEGAVQLSREQQKRKLTKHFLARQHGVSNGD